VGLSKLATKKKEKMSNPERQRQKENENKILYRFIYRPRP